MYTIDLFCTDTPTVALMAMFYVRMRPSLDLTPNTLAFDWNEQLLSMQHQQQLLLQQQRQLKRE